MGSEQSQPTRGKTARSQLARGHTIAAPPAPPSPPSTSGNDSPGTSVASDPDLPYISYTVDRPIGDSPKLKKGRESGRSAAPARRQLSLGSARRTHNIVVVQPAATQPSLHTDRHVLRLQEIPTFLPIMRGTLGVTSARDPQVLEGLECGAWTRLAARYQTHVAVSAQRVSSDQLTLAARVKETDSEVSRLLGVMVERQRSNARAAERLARVHDVSKQLTRCQSLLNQAMEATETLNKLLPVELRLEPFVWSV